MRFGHRIRVGRRSSRVNRGLLGGFRGSSEHLNYLLERRGISLNKGSGVRVNRFGSSDGFGRVQVMRWRHELLESIAGAATTGSTVSHAATWRRKERRRRRAWVFL